MASRFRVTGKRACDLFARIPRACAGFCIAGDRQEAMSATPPNMGLAMPRMTASSSLAATAVRVAEISFNPSSYELPVRPRSVVNQGTLPCCVSTALGGAMEIINSSWPQLAPLFHYYVTRFDNGGADAEGFLYLESGLATLTRAGICSEKLHPQPYTLEGASTKPTSDAYADAKTRALGRRHDRSRYSSSDGPSKAVWIRQQLKDNCPVVLGFQLPDGYPNFFLDANLEWRDPNTPPRTLSGHCVLVTGYDDTRQALHIQDSKGEESFKKGCWWMSYFVVDSTVVQQVYRLIP